MEKFLSIPISGGGHKLISATGIYMVEDSLDEQCVYVLYKDSNSIAKIYYSLGQEETVEGLEVKAGEEKTLLRAAGESDGISMAEAIENAIIHALQYSQGQVITTIHELPLPVDSVASSYSEKLRQVVGPKEVAAQA